MGENSYFTLNLATVGINNEADFAPEALYALVISCRGVGATAVYNPKVCHNALFTIFIIETRLKDQNPFVIK
jgi:hypothetical protein